MSELQAILARRRALNAQQQATASSGVIGGAGGGRDVVRMNNNSDNAAEMMSPGDASLSSSNNNNNKFGATRDKFNHPSPSQVASTSSPRAKSYGRAAGRGADVGIRGGGGGSRLNPPSSVNDGQDSAAKAMTTPDINSNKRGSSSPEASPNSELQEKLRERRLKATETYKKHSATRAVVASPTSSGGVIVAAGNQNVSTEKGGTSSSSSLVSPFIGGGARKSTFFPRSTPPVRNNSNGSAENLTEDNTRSKQQQQQPALLPSHTTATTTRGKPQDFQRTVAGRAAASHYATHHGGKSNTANNNKMNQSVLDLMAERYKEETVRMQQQLEEEEQQRQQHQQQGEVVEKERVPTYYRPGMKPPSSSPASNLNRWLQGSSAANGGGGATTNNGIKGTSNLPSSPSPTSSLYAAKGSDSGAYAPSDTSVVDGSVFSTTAIDDGNVPEFLRTKLKPTTTIRKNVDTVVKPAQVERANVARSGGDGGGRLSWQRDLNVDTGDDQAEESSESNGIAVNSRYHEAVVRSRGEEDPPSDQVDVHDKEDAERNVDHQFTNDSEELEFTEELEEEPRYYSNYDTAVLAAKEAIDASNRMRTVHHPHLSQSDEREAGQLNNTGNEFEDPKLRFESSLDSSDVGQPTSGSMLSGVGTADEQTNAQGNGAEVTEAASSNDVTGMTSMFGSSFVDASINMFGNDDDGNNKDFGTSDGANDFGFDASPFGADPFDPFAIGMEGQSGQGETVGETMDEGVDHNVIGVEATEVPEYEAELQDSFESGDIGVINEPPTPVEDGNAYFEESPKASAMHGMSRVSYSRGTDSHDGGEFSVDADNFAEGAVAASKMAESNMLLPMQQASRDGDGVTFEETFASFSIQPIDLSLGAIQRTPGPTTNPLTGNLIVCRCEGSNFVIEEVSLTRNQTSAPSISANILGSELKTKLAKSASISENAQVTGICSVVSLAAGVHRVRGRRRVRVAVIAEVLVVSSGSQGVRRMRVVAVWKWGYSSGGKDLASLQSVLTTSSIDDGSNTYDPKSLQVADGLLFLGGHTVLKSGEESKPVVFIAKPAVRDVWASVGIGDSYSVSVSALAVINDTNTFLAVGLTDGSVSVWTYDLAVRTNRFAGSGKQAASSLQIMCRMRGELDVSDLHDEDCLWQNSATHLSSADSGIESDCTSLSWISPCSSGISDLPLLAASFSSGVAVYHVSLPTQSDTDSSDAMSSLPSPFSSSVVISPLAQAKYFVSNDIKVFGRLSWFDLGPRSPPCLSLLLSNSASGITRTSLCAIDIPWYGSIDMMSPETSMGHRSMGVLCQNESNNLRGDVKVLGLRPLGAIGCYSAGSLILLRPSIEPTDSSEPMTDGYFASLSHPVSSVSLGLDNSGSIYSCGYETSAKSDYQDAVLTVYSVNTCSKESYADDCRNWSSPSQRNWLLITAPGDKTIDTLPRIAIEEDTMNDVERVSAVSDVLCELTCGENPLAGLTPERIAKEVGGRRAAVLFSSGYFGSNANASADGSRRRTHTRISPNPVAYAVIDVDEAMKSRGSTSFTLRLGRDVAFLPPSHAGDGFYCSSLVVLDHDGCTLSVSTVITSYSHLDGATDKIIESMDKCSLEQEGVEGRRVFALLNGRHPQLLLEGQDAVVGRPCLILLNHSLEKDNYSNTFNLLETRDLGQRLWLEAGEEVISVVELPMQSEALCSNIAVATQGRVMILSQEGSLVVVAEIDAKISCSSLSPLGSHCVAFCSTSSDGVSRIMYLSCLENGHGVILTLPESRQWHAQTLLTAIRPDRLISVSSFSGTRLVDDGEDENAFMIPLPQTRPLFLLEPLVANALCQDRQRGDTAGTSRHVQISLRAVIEKFGRKESPFPHSDGQGIGSLGTGITSKVYRMLVHHNCIQAASFLLTGNMQNATARPKILPPWIPVSEKLQAATDVASKLQVLASGDNELSGSLHQPNRGTQSALPKSNDSSGVFAQALAFGSLENGSHFDAINLLDFAGNQSSEDLLRQLVLLNQSNSSSDVNTLLQNMLQGSKNSGGSELVTQCDELITRLSLRKDNNPIVSHLAPSVQLQDNNRTRSVSINRDVVGAAFTKKRDVSPSDIHWSHSVNDSKHVWSSGPFGKKEEILELASFEDWLGTCRPSVLGKEGVAIAADTGERTLANILSAAAREDGVAKSNVTSNDNSISSEKKFWVNGIGEGRNDEDNLSLYVRFSEGADEDDNWKSDGFSDLTSHGHKVHLHGPELVSLEATTSSADEGEEGKVQLLYDLVYSNGAPRDQASGFFVDVARGGSLDVGMLHNSQHMSRQRCTLELWYHLPRAEFVTDEIILARRSICDEEDGTSNLCLPDEKHNTLWELAVLPTGFLELRTGAGSVLTTVTAEEDDEVNHGIVKWEREDGGGGWNHVCLIFSSHSSQSPTEFEASILMNGLIVASSATMAVNPFGAEPLKAINEDEMEDAMEKSVLVFGIGPSVGFRITEIRVWACRRHEDDVKMMMYEHLRDAEMKKKLKVNIRKGGKKSVGGLLPPPIRLPQQDSKRFGALGAPRDSQPIRTPHAVADTAAPIASFANFDDNISQQEYQTILGGEDRVEEESAIQIDNADTNETPQIALAASGEKEEVETIDSNVDVSPQIPVNLSVPSEEVDSTVEAKADPPTEPTFVVTFSELLSEQVRKSAASAIVRGPPAARHFGGNRGGLALDDRTFGNEHNGVGPVAICGADKSIVFFNDRDPPAKTYPIGASGAVLSDVMDENQSEYMCCFLAKEKRMVVFELTRKTVVVELQMKTKLNFWRYLPPEVHGGDLTFLMITPIGGFHWKPLDDSPRPRQVWKRGSELESKKILAYEEGGSNGQSGEDSRSTVALVLASSVTSDVAVEAYCIPMHTESSPLCISLDVLGAALYRPPTDGASFSHFLPYVATVFRDEDSQFVLTVQDLRYTSDTNDSLGFGGSIDSTILDVGDIFEEYSSPPMSMGTSPEAFCCCHGGFIVVVMRRIGMIFAYDFTSAYLSLVGKSKLGQYVVDAAIRSSGVQDQTEVVLLLCENSDSKDGRIATVRFNLP